MVARHSPRSVLIQLAAAAGGSILYALSICLTSILAIPGADNVQLRPGVVVPIVVGALFGPAAGFTSGCAGNLAADQLQLDVTAKTYRYLDDEEQAAAQPQRPNQRRRPPAGQ